MVNLGVNVQFCERRRVGWVKREGLDKTLFKMITLLEEFAEVTSILPSKEMGYLYSLNHHFILCEDDFNDKGILRKE